MDAVSAILATRHSRRFFFFKLRVARLIMTQARNSRTIGSRPDSHFAIEQHGLATWISFEHGLAIIRRGWDEQIVAARTPYKVERIVISY